MRALAELPAEAGAAAMQGVNARILNSLFFTVFFGTAVACVVVLAGAPGGLQRPGAAVCLAGSPLYLVGVTAAANVPMDNRLARLSPEAEPAWRG